MPRTIGAVRAAMISAQEASDASTKAAVDANAKAKADSEAFSASKVTFAGALKKTGDYFELNPDGTAIAYFASPTSPDGFFSEVLKGKETDVEEEMPAGTETPVETPPMTETPPVGTTAPVDTTVPPTGEIPPVETVPGATADQPPAAPGAGGPTVIGAP